MFRRRSDIYAGAIALVVAACSDAPVTGPGTDVHSKSDVGGGNGQFALVMTQNVLLGTDINIVLSAPAAQVPVAVGAAYALVAQSEPAARMARIADEIVAARPDVVGLQEAVKWLVQRPGDFIFGNQQPAATVEYDMIQLIIDALHARGVDYEVAAVVQNTDIELPALLPGMPPLPQNFFDVRLIDRDAILVRSGVKYENSQAGNYQAGLTLNIGSVSKKFLRGWASIDMKVHGRTVRFVTTHLEVQTASPIQVAQTNELLAITAQSPIPVIMAGDFNSAANPAASAANKTPSYAAMITAGFTDAWAVSHPSEEGVTCCQLTHPATTFDQRIDLVLYRGLNGVGLMNIVGEESNDRTASGLWPSDHAGVVAQIRLP